MAVGKFVSDWYRRYLSDPQAVLLVAALLVAFAVLFFMGRALAPVLAAVVVAYLLEGPVAALERAGLPRWIAVGSIFAVFVAVLVFLVVGVMPLLSRQLTEFVQQLPRMITEGQQLLAHLPERYPDLITETQVRELGATVRAGITELSGHVVSVSLASIATLATLTVYVVLVPLLVFFFLKDKDAIIGWLTRFLPRERQVLTRVWAEMDAQIGNYVRGKAVEILIVGGVTFVTFALLGVTFAPLLAVLVGLSVIVPYIGAIVVTVPVALAGYLQFGWSQDYAWMMLAYLVIQVLDGNVLVPVLFSEAVNLHPVAIITAVLVFGGLWGFWGVFFAIPLATLVKALLNVWPRVGEPVMEGAAAPGEAA